MNCPQFSPILSNDVVVVTDAKTKPTFTTEKKKIKSCTRTGISLRMDRRWDTKGWDRIGWHDLYEW